LNKIYGAAVGAVTVAAGAWPRLTANELSGGLFVSGCDSHEELPMEFRKVQTLRGPNIWANFPVLEAWVDLGDLKDSPSDELPGFNERLMAWLPTLVEHRCSVGTRGGFFERLRRGTYQAHILEHVALELQTLAGTEVGFGRTRETSEDGVYKVAIEYEDEELAQACLHTARALCLAAVRGLPFDAAAEVQTLRELADRVRPTPGTAAIVQATRRRQIPIYRFDGEGWIQLGYGARQRRLFVPHAERPSGSDADSSGSAGEASVARLFPEGQTGRIPIAAITGVNGKTTTTRLLAHIVGRAHRCVGMTCTEGIYIDGQRIESGDCSGPRSARTVLQHPKVEAAVLETARGGILREGLGFDRCDVAVVTNIAEGDHLGVADVETPEQLARVKRTLVEAVAPGGAAILKADDPLVVAMADRCPGAVVFFARDGGHPLVVRHRAANGRAAFVQANHIVLAEGAQEIPLVPLERTPLTRGGRIGFQVENALAAAAAAWSLGVPCEEIRVGLQTFAGGLDKVPGRFNLLEVNGATVVLDYGHNVSSLACMLEVLRQFPHPRRAAVYSAAGDRRDCDLVRQGAMLGDAFDVVMLYEDHYTRGRKPGEIMALFRQGLAVGGRVEEVHEVQGAVKAMETALASVHPGELLLIQADEIDESVEFMRRYLAAGHVGREIDFSEALATSQPEPAAALCEPVQ
jgi:cyanophycin synthetase